MKQLTNVVTDFVIGKTIIATGRGSHPFMVAGTLISFVFADKSFILLHIHNGDLTMPTLELELDVEKAIADKHGKGIVSKDAKTGDARYYSRFLADLKLIDESVAEDYAKKYNQLWADNEKEQLKNLLKKYPEVLNEEK